MKKKIKHYEKDGIVIECVIIKKQNKHTYVRVHEKQVIITTHHRVRDNVIDQFIESHFKTLYTKIIEQSLSIEDSKTVTLYGKTYAIKMIQSEKTWYDFKDQTLTFYTQEKTDLEALWIQCCIDLTQQKVDELLNKHQSLIMHKDIQPSKIRVKWLKSRHGSCNHKTHAITINGMLAKHPLHALEYVLFHELAHIKHPNHSAQFYAYLNDIYPEYRIGKKLLK